MSLDVFFGFRFSSSVDFLFIDLFDLHLKFCWAPLKPEIGCFSTSKSYKFVTFICLRQILEINSSKIRHLIQQ